jgi:polar amino acid transport system permease protein
VVGYNWQWYRVPRYLFTVVDGRLAARPVDQRAPGHPAGVRRFPGSVRLFGMTTAVCRLSGSFAARAMARAYLELIRNTPLLVQLFFIYFRFFAHGGDEPVCIGGPGTQPV